MAMWAGLGKRYGARSKALYYPSLTPTSGHLALSTRRANFLLVKMTCSDHHHTRRCLTTLLQHLNEDGEFYAGEVIVMVRRLIGTKSICTAQLLQAIYIAETATDIIFSHRGVTSVALNKASLGLFIAECVARKMLTISATVTGHWEDVVWAIVILLWKYDIHYINAMSPMSGTLKYWVLLVFNYRKVCPNHHLRLQMLRFISQFTTDEFWNPTLGIMIESGMMNTGIYMSVDHLTVQDSRESVVVAFVSVLESIRKCGYLLVTSSQAIQQIRDLLVGPEAKCLAHLVELAGKAASKAQGNRRTGLWSVPKTLTALENASLLLERLLTVAPLSDVYETPGLSQMAAASLVKAMTSVLAVMPTLEGEEAARCSWIISSIDDILRVLVLREKPQSVVSSLRRDHGQALAELGGRASDMRFPLQHLPQEKEEKSTEGCPKRFLDSVTLGLMEAPVRLNSSMMVVDESTLVNLLLVSPKDPFTRLPLKEGSYSRLPDLQEEIRAWKNGLNPN